VPEAGTDNAFHKSPGAVIGDGDTMVLPDVPRRYRRRGGGGAGSSGKRASGVRAADAMDYIFGYLNFIDGSARRAAAERQTFYQMKSRATLSRPWGPIS